MLNKKILVYGSGYVGASLGVLLSEKYETILIDIDKSKIDKINNKISPIKSKLSQKMFDSGHLILKGDCDPEKYLHYVDIVFIALPTNFDEELKYFDTSLIEQVIKNIYEINKKIKIVIKSTVPIGFTDKQKNIYQDMEIYFCPEFIREDFSIEDNISPNRIIVGSNEDNPRTISNLLHSLTNNSPEILLMPPKEAEAVKLFSNAYLANRVSFFNELDTFCMANNLNTEYIINGVCKDQRIGDEYNNPSFGYGGYCLPKDTKQLLSLYKSTPQSLISSIVKSNSIRKEYIAQIIINKNPNVVGIYKLSMKKDSDNYRESAILDIINILKTANIKLIIYEPDIKVKSEHQIINSLEEFIDACDLIVANRIDSNLYPFKEKVFTRDIYESD